MPSPLGRERCYSQAVALPAHSCGVEWLSDDFFVRFAYQCHRFRHPDRRLLCRRHVGRVAIVRHSRHRQYRASRLYHSRLLRRLYRQQHAGRRSDPDSDRYDAGVLRARRRHLSDLLRVVRKTRPGIAARTGLLLRSAVHHRSLSRALFRRRLPLRRSALYRADLASGRGRHAAAHAGAVRGVAVADRRAATRAHPHLHRPRHHGGGAGSIGVAADGDRSDPHQTHRLWHFDRDGLARRRLSHHHPAGRAFGRARIYRPRLCHLRARRHGQSARRRDRRDADRHRRKPDLDVLRPILGARPVVRVPVADAGGTTGRPIGTLTVRTPLFLVICLAVAALVFAGAIAVGNDYVFFAGYVILQYVVLSTAWNILGGYCGYVNFGSAAFFALGAYSTVAIYKLMGANDLPHLVPMPVLMLVGGVVSGVVGFGMGYLTLRLRGAFFAIATLALAVVLQTLIVNWDFVGGSRGAYILRPEEVPLIGSYIKYLFLVMRNLGVGAYD